MTLPKCSDGGRHRWGIHGVFGMEREWCERCGQYYDDLKAAAFGPSESDFQRQVTDLAEILGWTWVHFRPAQTSKGWRTPVSGPLGKGWPDLVLVREKDRRLMFVELKRNGAPLSPEQHKVWCQLTNIIGGHAPEPEVTVWVWRPEDFELIQRVLR